MNNRTINWQKWLLIPNAKIWEIVALSLDIEPTKVEINPYSWMSGELSFNESPEFKDRIDILMANVGTHSLLKIIGNTGLDLSSTMLSISEVGAWAESIGWSLPQEFPKQVRKEISPQLCDINQYMSNQLKILNKASKIFWANADINEPETHPKNDKVAVWLESNGFTKTLAEKGATIIRPDWAHKGRKPEE